MSEKLTLVANVKGLGWTQPIEYEPISQRPDESNTSFNERKWKHVQEAIINSLKINGYITSETV